MEASQKQCLDLIQQTQKSWTKQSHNSTFLHTKKQNKEENHKFISSLQEQSPFKSQYMKSESIADS